MTTSAASAPSSFTRFTDSMHSWVAFEPAPAMTGTRPRTVSTTARTTSERSWAVRVTPSPVVPQGTMPSVPSASCHSVSSRSERKSTPPSFIGVTMATSDPWNRMGPPGGWPTV